MLRYLDLRDANFSGMVPTHLGNLSNLQHLAISSSFDPLWVRDVSWLSALSSLQYLYMDSVNITSTSHELFRAVNMMSSLLELRLIYCNLRTLPPSLQFENITSLSLLDLFGNPFNSSIPSWLFNMSSLTKLYLSSSSLREWIPPFKHLSDVDICDCQLGPTFPSWLRNLTLLDTVFLKNVGISGEIPHWFYNMSSQIWELDLSHNKLNGYLPKICNFSNSASISLAFNQLNGSIPLWWSGVDALDLSNNLFSGTLPTNISEEMSQLTFLDISNNHIYGSIPLSINRIQNLSYLALSNNYLTGTIPMFWIEKLTELIHLGILNLSWNRLTGNIPNNIGSLEDLESLDLSHNHLSGPIPASMASMTFLSNLNLSYNNLSGQIPVGNQFDTFNDPSSYEGNPKLCGKPLPTNCSSALPGNEEKGGKHEDGADEKIEGLWLYGSIAFGYITGFWLVCGSLMLKRSWRHAYFNFAFDMRDKLLVLIAVNLARVKRKFGLERN
uniref:Receptor-like protein kinase 2 n=1 Tax=Cajanus cajan TaxID=3821 RepID=A0A151R1K9_CAJCA|nr:Receptor-like protein kinase 2 [Cajanus cajan]